MVLRKAGYGLDQGPIYGTITYITKIYRSQGQRGGNKNSTYHSPLFLVVYAFFCLIFLQIYALLA